MRILATQETDWMSRNPIIHHRLLEWLSTHGSDVLVIDFDIDWAKRKAGLIQPRREWSGASKYFADSRVRVVRPAMIRLPFIARLSWLLGNWREMRRIFARAKPDVVVGYGISNALVSCLLSRAAGRSFVYHVMDALHTHAEHPLVRLVARAVERLTMRLADRVVVVSAGLGRYARDMGASRERTSVVPIGVHKIGPDPELGARTRAGLGVADGEVMAIFVGWQYPFSGLRELLLDFVRRGIERPWLRLVIVGDGDLYPELARIRTSAGSRLERQVLLTGRRPVAEMPALIEAADLGLLPARRNETMEHLVPTKVVEYMEHGKAVVATRLPGLEAEFGGLAGLLYIDRPEQVIDRLDALDPAGDGAAIRGALRTLGETCREAIQRRPDWDAVTAEFEAILQAEAERRRR